MLICPKCKQTYSEGSQRFCTNDGARLNKDFSEENRETRTTGVFTNLVARSVQNAESESRFSSIPRFSNAEATTQIVQRPVQEQPLKPMPRMGEKAGVFASALTKAKEPKRIHISDVPSGTADVSGGDVLAPAPDGDTSVSLLKGRYKLGEMRCHFGNVKIYDARDVLSDNQKTSVTLLTESAERPDIVRLSHLNHPNLIRTIDSGETADGTRFVVSEFVEGGNAAEFLEKNGAFNPLRVARVIRQASHGLSEAHQNGILHKHLKPENIYLGVSDAGTEQIKVGDFGIGGGEDSDRNLNFAAPETIDRGVTTFSSDVYSLAVVAYQMLTNRLPFNLALKADVLKAKNEGMLLSPSTLRADIPPIVDDILNKAMSYNPTDRYGKARDFGDALFNALTTVLPEEKPAPTVVAAAEPVAEATDEIADDIRTDIHVTPRADSPIEEMISKPTANDANAAWIRRSPEPPSTMSWAKIGLFGGIILALAGLAFLLWKFMPNRLPDEAASYKPENSAIIQQPEQNITPVTEVDPNAVENGDFPPEPRDVIQPAGTAYYQNRKGGLRGDLLRNFLGFKLYYPEDWTVNKSPADPTGKTRGKFLDISKKDADGTPIELMLVSYYDSNGTINMDRESFPKLVSESNVTLSKLIPGYRPISDAPIKIHEKWHAYELRFEGGNDKMKVWGRRIYVPVAQNGAKVGYEITMMATSRSKEVFGIDDVGVKGDLGKILYTFEPNQSH